MSIPHPTLLPPVRTDADLTDRWRLLLADDEVTDREATRTDLWIQTYDADGVQRPALIVVDDVPDLPHDTFVDNLAGVLGDLLAQETAGIGAVAFGLCPGSSRDVAAADLRWATDLSSACSREGVRVLGVHLVCEDGVHRVV